MAPPRVAERNGDFPEKLVRVGGSRRRIAMSQYPTQPPGQYPPMPPSQYPPMPPVGYASAYVRTPDPRPTSVKVISWMAIVFGSLGLLGGLCSIPQYLGVQMSRS